MEKLTHHNLALVNCALYFDGMESKIVEQVEAEQPLGTTEQKTPESPGVALRRTHAQMRTDMRNRLVEATVSCIIEKGYAHSSVQVICAQAGVSKGALFRHYATRVELMGEAAAKVYADLIENFEKQHALITRDENYALNTLTLLRQKHTNPLYFAAAEFQIAARCDEKLRELLAPTLATYLQASRELAVDLFPGAAKANKNFTAIVDLIQLALRGEATIGFALVESKEVKQERFDYIMELSSLEILSYEK